MKNRKNITALLLCFITSELSAQVDLDWSRPYGGAGREEGRAIITTSDNEFYVLAGSTTSRDGEWDFYAVKTETSSAPVWEHVYEFRGHEKCSALVEMADGGFVLAGYAGILNHGYEYMLVKTDIEGNRLWTRTYGSPERHDYCYNLISTEDSGLLMIGRSTQLEYYEGDAYVVKTDSSGDVVWETSVGGNKNDILYCGCLTPDGGYLLGGGSNSYGSGGGFLAKLSDDGDLLWSRIVGVPGYSVSKIIASPDSGYSLTGPNYNGGGIFFMRVNEEGDSIFDRGFDLNHEFPSMIETFDGGYAITGQYVSPVLLKLDNQGAEEWRWAYGHYPSIYTGLVQSADEGYCMVGTASELSESQDIWLVKTGPVGQSIPRESIDINPDRLTLIESYPNPFNSSTTLSYSLPRQSPIKFAIYDLSGRLVETLTQGITEAGEHSVVWTAPGSGVYFATLKVEGEGKAVRKLVCIK